MCPAAEKIIFFLVYRFSSLRCRLDFADVVLYFNQMEWIAAHKPVSAFDPNGEGRIDFADIMALVNEI
jgi:PKD repeat protein